MRWIVHCVYLQTDGGGWLFSDNSARSTVFMGVHYCPDAAVVFSLPVIASER